MKKGILALFVMYLIASKVSFFVGLMMGVALGVVGMYLVR